MTGFIRSWIGGAKEPTADQTSQQSTTSAVTVPTPEPEVTHTTNLKSGTTAQVATAPDHSAGEYISAANLVYVVGDSPYPTAAICDGQGTAVHNLFLCGD